MHMLIGGCRSNLVNIAAGLINRGWTILGIPCSWEVGAVMLVLIARAAGSMPFAAAL